MKKSIFFPPLSQSLGLLRDNPITCLPRQKQFSLFFFFKVPSPFWPLLESGRLVGDLVSTSMQPPSSLIFSKSSSFSSPHLLLLGQKGLEALPLLFIELQLSSFFCKASRLVLSQSGSTGQHWLRDPTGGAPAVESSSAGSQRESWRRRLGEGLTRCGSTPPLHHPHGSPQTHFPSPRPGLLVCK